jgi:cell division protein FtsL
MLEPLLITLLVVVSLAIAWFSVYVIYKLFKGQA